MRVVPGKRRCRFHGGLSTGPRTMEGRARIAEAQRRRWRAFRDVTSPRADAEKAASERSETGQLIYPQRYPSNLKNRNAEISMA